VIRKKGELGVAYSLFYHTFPGLQEIKIQYLPHFGTIFALSLAKEKGNRPRRSTDRALSAVARFLSHFIAF
jgi:hypothetical protein